jgi:tetratricopeptide (TPR) repeat protein
MRTANQDGSLVSIEQRRLTPAIALNPLVARGLGDVRKEQLKTNCAPHANPAAHACYLRGMDFLNDFDFENAIKSFDEAIRFDAHYALAYQTRAEALLCHGDQDDKAVDDINEALRLFDEAVRLHPNNAMAYIYRAEAISTAAQMVIDGEFFEADGVDKEAALKDLDTAIRLEPNNAYAHYRRFRIGHAEGDLDNAIRLEPNNADWLDVRAENWCRRKEYDKAIDDFTEALRIDPTRERTYRCRGRAWMEKKEYAHAIHDFGKAIELAPDISLFWSDRAYARLASKDFGNAISDFEHFLRLRPESGPAHRWIAWTFATWPEADFRDGQRAIQLGTRAVELSAGGDGLCLDTLAAAYAEDGQFEKAIRYAQVALEDGECAPAVKDGIRRRLELYMRETPFRITISPDAQ